MKLSILFLALLSPPVFCQDGTLTVPVVPGTTTITITQQPAGVPSPTPTPGATPAPSASPGPGSGLTALPGNYTPAVALPAGFVLAFDEEFAEGAAFAKSWVVTSDKPGLSLGGRTAPRWFTQKPGQGGIQYFFNSFSNPGTDVFPGPFTADAKTAGYPAGPATAGPLADGYGYILGAHVDARTSANDTLGDFGGLLSSLDTAGNGFSAALAYWEAKIWLPPVTTGSPANATGLWPGWWLLAADTMKVDAAPKTEIDIMEAYSVDYTRFHTNLHRYNQASPSPGANVQAPVDLSLGWHVYSCLVDKTNVTFYLDGAQVSQFPSVATDWAPMFCMLQLAEGGGWPDQNNWGTDPNPGSTTSYAPWSNTTNMKIAYVRVWALPGNF
jgi:hypothetical protein